MVDLRKIDRLVAEKVMGWVQGEYAKDKWYYKKNGQIESMAKFINDWNPSTNIADAWQVVEKLRKDNIMIDITPSETVYFASVRHQGKGYIARSIKAETAPFAICLVALKACGIDVEV